MKIILEIIILFKSLNFQVPMGSSKVAMNDYSFTITHYKAKAQYKNKKKGSQQ